MNTSQYVYRPPETDSTIGSTNQADQAYHWGDQPETRIIQKGYGIDEIQRIAVQELLLNGLGPQNQANVDQF